MGIGTLIREHRRRAGLSQAELAAELATLRPTITRDELKDWEREEHLPGPMWQTHLASVLGVPLAEVKAAVTVSRMRRRTFLALGGLTAVNAALVSDLTACAVSGDYVPMRDRLTPYAVDHAMARIVKGDRGAIRKLTSWMQDGETAKLRVNAGSILWKTGDPDLVEAASRQLVYDEGARDWQLTCYARRLFGLPWTDARTYNGRRMPASELRVHTRELASLVDPDSRWAAAVFLGQAVQGGDKAAHGALLKALRVEPARENLRLIGLALAGEQPWKEA